MQFFPGTTMTLRAAFTDADGNDFDPTTVKCDVKPASGPKQIIDATKDSAGHYSAQYVPTLVGLHLYIFRGLDGSGDLQAAARSSFQVQDANL